ncbi:MAG: hypothetical protein OXF74_14555 [Rhodobacteraceae bacterium]|nr:hypothetical protein [Paracoccaceae bacterium]
MNSYIRFKFGDFSVEFEGSEDFIAQSLPKLVSDMAARVSELPADIPGAGQQTRDPRALNLADLIKSQGKLTQVRRFLTAAAWLQATDAGEISTGHVVRALKDNLQPRLTNPSDCLNANVRAGCCERSGGNRFFVTAKGMESVGLGEYL